MVKTCFVYCSLCWGVESVFITRKECFLYIGPSIKYGLCHWVQGLSLVFPAGTSWVGSLALEHLLIKTVPLFRILGFRNPTCWTVPQIIVMFNVTYHHWKHITLAQYVQINRLGSRVVFTLLIKQCVASEPLMMLTVLLFDCVGSMNYHTVSRGHQCNRELGAVCNKTLLFMLSWKCFGEDVNVTM